MNTMCALNIYHIVERVASYLIGVNAFYLDFMAVIIKITDKVTDLF